MSMLSRFSRTNSFRLSLASITSSLTGKSSTGEISYNKDALDAAVAEIKTLGKKSQQYNTDTAAIDHHAVVADVRRILALMKHFAGSLQVQRVACHALSNLAMQVVIARHIVSNNGFKHIEAALKRFMHDHKLCWLASSAVWNIARPPANRELVGTEGVRLMLQVLEFHFEKHEKVTNTAIGALSNLSLCEPIKAFVGQTENVRLLLKVLSVYAGESKRSVNVMTSGAGLLANLAVSDEYADILLMEDALPVLLELLLWSNERQSEEAEDEREITMVDTMHRNSCAALNNMVSAEHFLEKVLSCNGVEVIFQFLQSSENELFVNLINNCLSQIGCTSENPMSTMHLCAMHGQLEQIKDMVKMANDGDVDMKERNQGKVVPLGHKLWETRVEDMSVAQLVNQTDASNMTCMQYAQMCGNYEMIEFLVKCGADSSVVMDADSPSAGAEPKSPSHADRQAKVDAAVAKGNELVRNVVRENECAVQHGLAHFPTDLCNFLVTFQSHVDMLVVKDQF